MDWLLTARQTLPRLRQVLTALRPTYTVEDVRSIDVSFAREQHVKGLIWDVDGTLTNYHGMQVADELHEHVERLFHEKELRHAILSNCDERRFDELKTVFPELPLIRAYKLQDDVVFRTARGQDDTHSIEAVNKLFAAGARQIRKPDRVLIEHAVEVLELPPEQCVMVGDQYFTDIASANLAGIRSVKVKTFGKKTFPRSIRTTQRFEPILFRLFNGRTKR